MRRIGHYNRSEIISAAFDFLWADNLRLQTDGEWHHNEGQYYYVTASDLEAQVRLFIQEDLQGKKRGSSGRAWGKGYSHVRVSGNLFSEVRDWLLRNPKLEGHNFGRGHISGMRFRLRGAPLHPAEQATIDRNRKRRENGPVIHYRLNHDTPILCSTKPRRSIYGRTRRRPYGTTEKEKVNCTRCKAALARGQTKPRWKCEEV